MRPVGRLASIVGCAACLLLQAHPLFAQQGSVHVTTAVQTLQGDPARFAGQNDVEPDFGVAWLQPGTRFGLFQMEIRGARRGDALHTGRLYGALRDANRRGLHWTIEAGDTYFSPPVVSYGFSNLFSPAVTFNGAAIVAHSDRSSLAVVAGRTTAWRNIFGNDPQGLGQTLGIVHVSHRPTKNLELSARGSRVRTSSLDEFTYTIDASDQAGGAARYLLTSSLQLVADGSIVSYRRTGTSSRERDGSYIGGLSWLHSRGWVQITASRFSPGDFPALNNPLQDREQVFAAGEYDLLPRMRLSGGWERFHTNLDPEASQASTRPTPETTGDRGFGGVRVQLTSRSTVAFRGEQGGRQSRPIGPGLQSDSDSGMWVGEWQAAFRRTSAFIRYSARDNVEHLNDSGSYDQRDASAQLFANLRGGSQVFGLAVLTRTMSAAGAGNTYWQAGGGSQLRLGSRDLWLRSEANAARNMDLSTRTFVPRESLVFGINGQLSRWTNLAFNVNLDRAVSPASTSSPWLTRSIVRVTHTLPTGSVLVPSTSSTTAAEAGRGTGTISGVVYADWNGNGSQDPGENTLEGIPLAVGAGHGTSGKDGQFAFLNVPVGVRSVGLDTTALPVDFDPPTVPSLQIELSRGETTRVAFGLVPLGSIHGKVVRDSNGNGRADANEESMDGAVVVLDGGLRSEQVRKGRYQFDAVRSGSHLVRLLTESLPDGAAIAGDAEASATLSRGSMQVDVTFVVSIDKRPEIRKVFPPRGGGPRAGTAVSAPRVAASGARTTPPSTTTAKPPSGSSTTRPLANSSAVGNTASPSMMFAIQIAALNDPLRAKDAVQQLKANGLPAYLVSPPASDPDAPYRVRVGPYRSREEAQKTAAALEAQRNEKLWVTREK